MIAWKPFGHDWSMASARLRCFLPCRYLSQAGWPCELFNLEHLSQYKIVIFQKIYAPEDIFLALRLKKMNCRVVFDLCDNHFYHPLDYETQPDERLDRLRRMIGLADAVSVSTPQLATLVDRKDCRIIDDAVDDFPDNAWHRFRGRLSALDWRIYPPRARLVWFGNAGTLDPPSGLADLGALIPELNRLNRSVRISLGVISNSRSLFDQRVCGAEFPVRYFEWDRRTFRSLFRRHDVCLLPVSQNPFTICKTNNRLLLSLLLGLPAVADPIPSYGEFSRFALFGDWSSHLRTYLENRKLAREHVATAREYIRREYTPLRVVRQWSELFDLLGIAVPTAAGHETPAELAPR